MAFSITKARGKNDVDPKVNKTDFSAKGIRTFLLQRNYDVMVKVVELNKEKAKTNMPQEEYDKKKNELIADKKAPIVLIKATNEASYRNLVDILDEMAICNIGRYAIIDITDYDFELLKNAGFNQ